MTKDSVFRAAWTAYAMMCGIMGSMTVYCIYATLEIHASFWKAAASFAAALLLTVVWLATFEIRITDHELIFRSLFKGIQRLPLNAVERVEIGFRLDDRGGPLRLLVSSHGDPDAMAINAKVFSREAIHAVLALAKKQPSPHSIAVAEYGVVGAGLRNKRNARREK